MALGELAAEYDGLAQRALSKQTLRPEPPQYAALQQELAAALANLMNPPRLLAVHPV